MAQDTQDTQESKGSRNKSGYDKNIRSLLDAVAMLEREVGVVLDRVGVDRDTVGRALEVAAVLSADVARQAANALGLADARAMESLGRDVRALLEQVARLRKRDEDGSVRIDRIEEATARLDGAASTLARLQGKAQGVLARLEERSAAFEEVLERRTRQLDSLDGLRARIERLEGLVQDTSVALELRPPRLRAARPVRSLESSTQEPGQAVDSPIAKPAVR